MKRFLNYWDGLLMNKQLRRPTSRTILMLDLQPDALVLQVLTGSELGAEQGRGAVCLIPPAPLWANGEMLMPELLGEWVGEWLQVHLKEQAFSVAQIDGVYVVLDNAFISAQNIQLPVNLSEQDIAFQLLAEVRAVLPADAPEVCFDYVSLRNKIHSAKEHQIFEVRSVAKAHVDAAYRLAKGLGARLCGVLMHEALNSSQASSNWQLPRFNFMPHCMHTRHAKQLVLSKQLGRFALVGVVFAMGLSMLFSQLTQAKTADMLDASEVAATYAKTQQAYEDALKTQQREVDQTREMQVRLGLQQQTLQWSRVLRERTDGIWVLNVQQQGARWTMEGEALSASHVQHMLQHLQALNVWLKPPELTRLEVAQGVSVTGVPVWQFRVDADLKAGI